MTGKTKTSKIAGIAVAVLKVLWRLLLRTLYCLIILSLTTIICDIIFTSGE